VETPRQVVVGDNYELSPLGLAAYRILEGVEFNREEILPHNWSLAAIIRRLGECAFSNGHADLIPYRGDWYIIVDGQVYDRTSIIKECWNGEFVDPRDGNTYHAIKIGKQTWMAENLKYEGVGIKNEEYGHLYNWKEAEKACPDGWHLPTKEEFESLLSYIDHDCCSSSEEETSRMLRNKSWHEGYDMYGFNAMPVRRMFIGRDNKQEYLGCPDEAYYLGESCSLHLMTKMIDCRELKSYESDCFFAVRCVKD
jgi:uncharacterized protein (TIGR02145 family)